MRTVFVLLCLICFATLTQSILGSEVKINDAVEYTFLADNVLDKGVHYAGNLEDKIDFRLFSKRSLGYPAFILVNWQNQLILQVAQLLLLVYCFFIGLHVLRLKNANRTGAIVYGVGFLTSLVLFFHTSFTLSDLLLCAAISSMYLLLLQTETERKYSYLGVLWAFALLVKPVMLPSLLLVPALFVWLRFKKQRTGLNLALPVTVWLAVCLFHLNQTGIFEYSSISTINLSQYNAKLTVAKVYGYDSAQSFSNNLTDKLPSSSEEYLKFKESSTEKALAVLSGHPVSYAQVHLAGMIKMLLDPGRFELFTYFGVNTAQHSLTEMLFAKDLDKLKDSFTNDSSLYLTYAVLLIIRFVALIGFAISVYFWRRNIIGLVFMLYFLTLTGPVGAARFFLPVLIIFLAQAALGWQVILNSFQKSTKR